MLQVKTTSGPVLGFCDTFPLSDHSHSDEIEGGADGGLAPVDKWLAVPYARAARWKRPVAPSSWEAPLRTCEFGSKFPQTPPSAVKRILGDLGPAAFPRKWIEQSEDSHSLNIYSPPGAFQGTELLPVMVYVPGGGLMFGSADQWYYDATEWVRRNEREGRKAIIVVINYRTNVFGFLAHPDLVVAGEDCGNYGLYDAVAAFEWVKSNITAFGGDPSNITAFGESAGSQIVSFLLATGKPLFRRVILQSGFPSSIPMSSIVDAYPSYDKVVAKFAPDAKTPQERLAALRDVPAADLLQAHMDNSPTIESVHAVLEGPGGLWTQHPVLALTEGKWGEHVEEVIVGTVENEGSLFALVAMLAIQEKLSSLPSFLRPTLNLTSPKSFYLASLLGNKLFIMPSWLTAQSLSSTLHHTTEKPCRVYVFRLRALVPNYSAKGAYDLGIVHTCDIPLVFNSKGMWEEGSSEEKVSQAIGARWVDFAASGVPDPAWTPFTSEKPTWLVFEEDGKVVNEDLTYWNRLARGFWSRSLQRAAASVQI